jgi:hypothetical protein
MLLTWNQWQKVHVVISTQTGYHSHNIIIYCCHFYLPGYLGNMEQMYVKNAETENLNPHHRMFDKKLKKMCVVCGVCCVVENFVQLLMVTSDVCGTLPQTQTHTTNTLQFSTAVYKPIGN